MLARCPSARVIGQACLGNYRLSFVQPHAGWGGGVAGIVADDSDSAVVHGVVYTLTAADLRALDGFEPTESGHYWRAKHEVRLADQRLLNSWVYIGEEFPNAPYLPSMRYLQVILDGAEAHGLPAGYIAALRRWPTGLARQMARRQQLPGDL